LKCNVCGSIETELLFESESNLSLTSLCEIRAERLRTWLCLQCSHLQGVPIENLDRYYDVEYRILLNDDDEDQIYDVRDEKIVYRTQHQISTLLSKLEIREGAHILDFGCAKASTPQALLSARPDISLHLFDVSSMYSEYWRRFISSDRWAINQIPSEWYRKFDVVTSFFALEHIAQPRETVQEIADLLSNDGVFYGIVPDAFGNIADFVVIDHVNHFTSASLYSLLSSAGFCDVTIDARIHRGALVFVARKSGAHTKTPCASSCLADARNLAKYWEEFGKRIKSIELMHNNRPSAIYGSGFYGAYIASVLNKPDNLQCFLDASPFRQGRTLLDRPILPPHELPRSIDLLYMGLNPISARSVVQSREWGRWDGLHIAFIDD
jgi:SAM-dependent methyltransferase